LPWLTAFTLVALAILLLLGAWQWRRFEEKRALLAAPTPAAVQIAAAPKLDGAVFVYAVLDGQAGWRVFAPVETPQGAVFADLGFAPGLEPPEALTPFVRSELSGQWVRPRQPSALRAPPDPAARRFYAIELEPMSRAIGRPVAADRYFAADYGAAPNPFVGAAQALSPERHLGYALTWWGLAGGLIAVYLALHASRGRLSLR